MRSSCRKTFRPGSNRQRYCSETCRNAVKVDSRREFRRIESQFRAEGIPENEASDRASPDWFASADTEYENLPRDAKGRLALTPDQPTREQKREMEVVTYLQSDSARYAWQLDSALLKAKDRQKNGLPGVFPSGKIRLSYVRNPETDLIEMVEVEELESGADETDRGLLETVRG
jgi:hypothetical protein